MNRVIPAFSLAGLMRVPCLVLMVVLVQAAPLVSPAEAFPDYVGTRGLAMGAAGRADARAGQAPLLNPAGMSLARLYTVEGGYQHFSRDGGHVAHASIVDSTSGFNLAGALFYSYRTAHPTGGGHLTGHEPGISLSFPFGDRLLVGVSAKYLRVSGGPAEPDGSSSHSGITADAGVILRAGSMLTIAVVGYNLNDLSTVQAPVGLGYGLAFSPTATTQDLVIALDGAHDFTTSDPTRGITTSVALGAEYTFQRRVVFRLGGGIDGRTTHNHLSAGLAAISELGAVDLGFRQDLSGDQKLTFIGVGLRLFVPQP